MNKLSDFREYGYEVTHELGRNLHGGRITYLARKNNNSQSVVIKQFQFATSGGWADYKAHIREIETLKELNHPGIPRYLESFDTPTGFCMVQEFKDAQPLSEKHSFKASEVREIAIKTLEIIRYLQNRLPPIIHRDIKPENILVDDKFNVYLVDFGFARICSEQGAMSSVAAGTFGFMPQEQIYNKQLTKSTDLYGLGATLICLLSGTKSTEMDALISEEGCIDFRSKVSFLSLSFVNWLEKMVQPKSQDRYKDAEAALEALKPLDITQSVKENLSQPEIPKLSYISITLMLLTSFLVAGAETIFEGNTSGTPLAFETLLGTLFGAVLGPGSGSLVGAILGTFVGTVSAAISNGDVINEGLLINEGILGMGVGSIAGILAGTDILSGKLRGVITGCIAGATSGGLLGGILGLAIANQGTIQNLDGCVAGIFLGALIGAVLGLVLGSVTSAVKDFMAKGFSKWFAMWLSLLTTGFGLTLSSGLCTGFSDSYTNLLLVATSLALFTTFLYYHLRRLILMITKRQAST